MVDWELDITGICPTNFPINIGIYSRRYVNMRICIYAIAAGMTQCRREAAGIFPITAGDEFYVLLPFIWKHMFVCVYIYIHNYVLYNINYTSSTAQGGGGSFKNRKPIGEVGCCESGMAERSPWWSERWLISLTISLSFSDYLPTYLPIYLSFYLSIYLPIYLSIYLSTYLPIYRSIFLFSCLSIYLSVRLSVHLSIYLSTYLPTYLPPSLPLSPLHLSSCLTVYLSIYLSVYLSICGAVSFSVM